MKLHVALLFITAMALSACGSLPKHEDIRMEEKAIIEVRGGDGVEVWVDGKMEDRISSDAKLVRVTVPSGNRSVVVKRDSVVLYQRSVFVQRGTVKVIDVKK